MSSDQSPSELSEQSTEFVNVIASSALEGSVFTPQQIIDLIDKTDDIPREEIGGIIKQLKKLGVLEGKTGGHERG